MGILTLVTTLGMNSGRKQVKWETAGSTPIQLKKIRGFKQTHQPSWDE
jgi:hypothetical protein